MPSTTGIGNVPIVTATNISINDVAQSSRSVVFDFVRSEIENAVPYLPNRNSVEKGEYYGRVTQAVAFFVLAKLYLNAEIYADDDWTDHKHLNGSDLHFTISEKDMNAWEACAFYCDLIGQMNYHLSEDYGDNFIVYLDHSYGQRSLFQPAAVSFPFLSLSPCSSFWFWRRKRHLRLSQGIGSEPLWKG